jgi:hypothetical protein
MLAVAMRKVRCAPSLASGGARESLFLALTPTGGYEPSPRKIGWNALRYVPTERWQEALGFVVRGAHLVAFSVGELKLNEIGVIALLVKASRCQRAESVAGHLLA